MLAVMFMLMFAFTAMFMFLVAFMLIGVSIFMLENMCWYLWSCSLPIYSYMCVGNYYIHVQSCIHTRVSIQT